MASTYNVVIDERLNIFPGSATPTFSHIAQYSGNIENFMEFTMYNDQSIWVIPSSVKRVVIAGAKPDGTGFNVDCTWSGSKVVAPLLIQMTTVHGPVQCRLEFLDEDNNKLASALFVLEVERAPLQSDVFESTNDFQAIQSMKNDAEYYSLLSKSYAVGNSAIRSGENSDNSKYYAYLAKTYKGSPLVADTVAGMTDYDRVYVYTGSESGYTAGNWYYWDGSAWSSGGIYNAQGIQTDTELILPGIAADAEAVGKRLDWLVTPEMFGAVGDGVTDDTEAVQAAIDTGMTCLLSKTYLVTTLYFASNRRIVGIKGSTIKSSGTAFAPDPDVVYLNNVEFSGFNIEAKIGMDLSSRTNYSYSFKIEDIIFRCEDYCIKATMCFQWYICNCWLQGTYGFVDIQGPGNTFENIYELNCLHMFTNCDGVFIAINVSNSMRTLTVFDYNDNNYGHDVVIINTNFEQCAGTLISNTSTCGFSALYLIGCSIINCHLDDYLFPINNPNTLIMWFGQVVLDSTRTKFINVVSGYSGIKSLLLNYELPFAVGGRDVVAPVQSFKMDTGSYFPRTHFSGLDAILFSGIVTPNQEDIPIAYTIRFNTGSLINLTSGTGASLGRLNPPWSGITGQVYIKIGTIVTIKNSVGQTVTISANNTVDYGFETTSTVASGATKAFILQSDGTHLQWHAL